MSYTRTLTVAVALATVAAAHPLDFRGAGRAAPGVIVFSGRSLRAPIVLSNWTENQRLMLATTTPVFMPDTALMRRLSVSVEMYWGEAWSRYAGTADSLAQLTRVREPQRGTYYPATSHQPAVWVFGPMGTMPSSQRLLSREGVEILRAHHLPTAVP